MPLYQIARIASYTGATPNLDGAATLPFHDLRGPRARPQRQVEIVTRPGVPGHGVRIGEVMGPTLRLRAVRYLATLGDVDLLYQSLKTMKPRLGQATDHGLHVTQTDIETWAWDLISVEIAEQRSIVHGAKLLGTPGSYGFALGAYDLVLKRRVDGPSDTNIL